MATARGRVTVTDITDGLPTISIIQTNENHSFTAGSDGSVTDANRTAYVNDITVLIGSDQAAYVTSTPTANNTFTIGTLGISPSNAVVASIATQSSTEIGSSTAINVARLTLSSITDAARDVQITLPIVVRRLNRNETINTIISLSKAVGGSAQSINVSASEQAVIFSSSDSTSATGTLTITAVSDGATGAFTWMRSVDGAAEVAVTSGISTSGNTSTLTVNRSDFGSVSSFITYRASRGTVTDRVSIHRLNQSPAMFIAPRVTSGALNLKNNTGSVTIVADVFRDNTEVTNYSDWSFVWNGPPANNADGTRANLTNSTAGITLSSVGGAANRQIVITASDYIEDDTAATIEITGTES